MEGIGLEKLNNVEKDLRKTPEDLLPLVLHFGKIPKIFGKNLAKIQKNSRKTLAKFAKMLSKSERSSAKSSTIF